MNYLCVRYFLARCCEVGGATMGEVVPTTLPRLTPTSGAFFFTMTYEEQLQTPEWKEKRQRVIDHYWGLCFRCSSTHNLQVHHRFYIKGRMAWEYPMSALIPLCADCHALEHNKVPERQPVKSIREVMVEWLEGLLKMRDA